LDKFIREQAQNTLAEFRLRLGDAKRYS